MKIKRETDEVELPPHSQITSVVLSTSPDRMLSYPLQFVKIDELVKMRQKNPDLLGRPVVCSCYQSRMLQLYPAADQDYELRVRYTPPEKEI